MWTSQSDDTRAIRAMVRDGVQRDTGGTLRSVFGLAPEDAADVLLRATRADALPEGFMPGDLVSVGGQRLRSIVVDDTRALIEAAAEEGNTLYVGSGFRSQAYQENVFAAQVRRWGDEDTANHYSARPGHSQHQLGTTVDFTNTFAAFRRSPAADWLRDNAHRFGFILPYTSAATPLTGYIDEPWHGRWLGHALAGQLQSLGYQEWTTIDADDVVALIRVEAALDG